MPARSMSGGCASACSISILRNAGERSRICVAINRRYHSRIAERGATMDMKDMIAALQPEIAAIRRDIHAHPELAFEETRTSDLVARYLDDLGLEVHRGVAKTGVIAKLTAGSGKRAI